MWQMAHNCVSLLLITVIHPLHTPHSSAILRYLVTKYKLPEHWYPTDTLQRAKVDEYLGWHSSNLRIGAAELIFSKVCIYSLSLSHS